MTYAAATWPSMDPEREAWLRRVAAATHNAAEELRKLSDPSANDLLDDLDDLHARLVEELRTSGLDG